MRYFQNKLKLERAKGELGPDASEDAIAARYEAMGGVVLEVADPVVETAVEKPKKTKKK